MSRTYTGSCHCGNIRFQFEAEEISHGLRCNCSLCERRGALMTPFVIKPDEFHISDEHNSLGCYTFGQATARHYFCKKCGIYPFHSTARIPDHYRVNIGCIDGIDSYELEIEIFDGKHLL